MLIEKELQIVGPYTGRIMAIAEVEPLGPSELGFGNEYKVDIKEIWKFIDGGDLAGVQMSLAELSKNKELENDMVEALIDEAERIQSS